MYLERGLDYSPGNQSKETQRTVIAEFTVSANGHVSGIIVIKHLSKKEDKEAARLISNGRWVASVQNGRSVCYRERREIAFP
ncbi:MAG: energy transducer TonB [Bacteroidota bacterium]|nr:energy transducer TonB [Bacteroidota bacterium]